MMNSYVDSTNKHLDRLISEKSVQVLEELHKRPKLKENFDIEQLKWPKLGALSYLQPMIDENQGSVIAAPQSGDNEISFTQPCERKQSFPESQDGLYEAAPALDDAPPDVTKNSQTIKLNEFQVELFSLLRSYKDLLYTNESIDSADDIQKFYVAHVLSHLMSSRSRILSNNKVFEKKTLCDKVIQDDPALRDQGYTRARILFLLPFRHHALKLGKCIVEYLKKTHEIAHLDRFIQEFSDEDGTDATLHPVACDGNKPSDFYHTFNGNIDDSFRIGIKLTKRCVKFFADFYDSDIIIASPLGLKTLITPDESKVVDVDDDEDKANEQVPSTGDKDFLSSIEIVILDQAEIFLMQNWEHIMDIMQHVNVMPAKPRKMDISRIRPWHLENWAKYYRQLIMFTSITVPLVHSFFQTYSLNYEGYIAFKHRVENPQARKISTKCTQHFLYYDSSNAKDSCDDRFSFFTKQVLPRYTGSNFINSNLTSDLVGASNGKRYHTLIFVSSYFDFVRLRNYFRREKLSFTQICEYTEANKISKARQLFYFGARQFLIYTERCHFYHRYKLKGIRNIIFYEPPTFAKFYAEMLGMMTPELQGKKYDESSDAQFTATTLFSNHDTLQMGAIIGFNNAVKLITNKKSIL